jgi:hypothetical protein
MASDFQLNGDGTVLIRVGGAEWRLRRPTLGEYRRAFELFQAADDRLQAALNEIPADNPTERVKVANRMQLGENGSAPLYGQLLIDLIGVIVGEAQLPDPLELPAWAVSSDASAQLLRHWRAVPLGPGVPD